MMSRRLAYITTLPPDRKSAPGRKNTVTLTKAGATGGLTIQRRPPLRLKGTVDTFGRRPKRVLAWRAVVLETFPPHYAQRHLALFPLMGEVGQQMGAGR